MMNYTLKLVAIIVNGKSDGPQEPSYRAVGGWKEFTVNAKFNMIVY